MSIYRLVVCFLLSAFSCFSTHDAKAMTSTSGRTIDQQPSERSKRDSTVVSVQSLANQATILENPTSSTSRADVQRLGGMPVWSEEEEKRMLTGKIWDDMPEVLPPNTNGREESESVGSSISSVTDEKGAVESIPEDFTKVLPHYLPGYIRPLEAGLIDPQQLLGEIEKSDVLTLISRIREKTGGHIYVSLFAPGQEVPPEINAPSLARQVFKTGETSLLLHIHYGDVKGTQIVCDPIVTEKLGDNGRRLLLSKVKEQSSLFTNPQDCLLQSIIALDELASPELKKHFLEERQKMRPHAVGVPTVNIEFTEKEEIQEEHLSGKIKELFAQHQGYAHTVMYGFIALLLLLGFYFWSRNCKPVKLLRTVPDKRLGAPNGASVSRPVNYGSRDDSSPYSISRKQMRDHMRENS